MTTIRGRIQQFSRPVAMLFFALGLLAIPFDSANGVSDVGKTSTLVTPPSAGAVAEYAFSRYKPDRNEIATGFAITLPAGSNVASATAASPTGSVSVSGQTVTVIFDTPVTAKTNFIATLGNVVNPPAGTYDAGSITIFWQNTATNATGTIELPTGTYTITSSFLSLTITTPGAGQTVEFGDIDPGVATAAQMVTVEVNSSAPYSIIRTPGADAGALGLTISGTAVGPKAQGLQTFTDTYVLNPLWTTDPSVPLTATIGYTVVQ